jgi:hypothetical protein
LLCWSYYCVMLTSLLTHACTYSPHHLCTPPILCTHRITFVLHPSFAPTASPLYSHTHTLCLSYTFTIASPLYSHTHTLCLPHTLLLPPGRLKACSLSTVAARTSSSRSSAPNTT